MSLLARPGDGLFIELNWVWALCGIAIEKVWAHCFSFCPGWRRSWAFEFSLIKLHSSLFAWMLKLSSTRNLRPSLYLSASTLLIGTIPVDGNRWRPVGTEKLGLKQSKWNHFSLFPPFFLTNDHHYCYQQLLSLAPYSAAIFPRHDTMWCFCDSIIAMKKGKNQERGRGGGTTGWNSLKR